MSVQSEALYRHILAACPDPDAQATAVRFFALGREVTGSSNPIGILLAGMMEAVGTWSAHSGKGATA